MFDHPLDYEIEVTGDWYHDPEVPEGEITWQYAVVPVGFQFPDIRYEIIDECYLPEHDPSTKSYASVDWDAVERQAYTLTGNEDMLSPQTKANPVRPKGRITITDKNYNGGRSFGVSEVLVYCNSFIKSDEVYTDKNGYYEMSKKFTAELTYRLIFENKEGFSIGFNLIQTPASNSIVGVGSPDGFSMTVKKDSGEILFKRCAVNNAVHNYIQRCSTGDLAITTPPANLRIWILHNLKKSGAIMMHHGAFVENNVLKTFLGEYAGLIKVFLPDLVVGLKNADDYRDIYSAAIHEVAHSSHFSRVGVDYWNSYLKYKVKNIANNGTYGSGTGTGAGHCEVTEMWAYYMESLMYKDRYGGDFPTFGKGYWFKPEILRELHKNGFKCNEICSVLNSDISSRDELETKLISKYQSRRTKIVQAFDKY